MLRKIITPAFAALLGLSVGSGSVEYIHHRTDQRSKEVFAQKEKCKSLADQYINQHNSVETSLALRKVDFSTANNSCIAAVDVYSSNGNSTALAWELVDLLSGEVTGVGSCNVERDCGNGRDMHFSERLDVLFKSAIEGTKPPKDTPLK